MNNNPNEQPGQKLTEADYNSLLSSLNQTALVSMTDIKGNIIYANNKFTEISKYSLSELLGQNHRILKSGHQPRELFVELWKTISSGQVWRGEIKNRAKDGTYYWVDTSIAPVIGHDGKPERYISVRFLITSRKKLEEETLIKVKESDDAKRAMLNIMEDLQAEKEKINEQKLVLDSILTNLPVGVSFSSPGGRIMMVNRSGIKLLGRVIDPDTTKDNFSEIYRLHKQDGTPYPAEEIPINIVLKEGKTCTKDDIIVNKMDNTSTSLRVTSVPIRNAEGEMSSIITVFEDITHDKDVDRMKTEFISLASHQLRTPLSAIKWFSEMLIGGDAGELTTEQKDFAKNITDSTKRMIDLVNSLLNISRIESGRIIIDPQPTNLKELLDDIVKELQVKINQRHQNLVVSVHDDLPMINLDPRLIRQVYINFLTNAIKYSPVGGDVSVFVSRKGNDVISQITDSGYGVPKAEQPKLFKKFFRATNVIKVEAEGTGLGLYLVKAIIESSKGKVWFQSDEGKGTTFWFSLPITGMTAKEGEVSIDS